MSPSLECLGVVVSCLAVLWPTPPSIFYVFCYSVFRQDIPYVRFVILVSDLHRILGALVLMTLILGKHIFLVFRIRTYMELSAVDFSNCLSFYSLVS